MEWLTKEFKPMMDKRYPTLPGRANTAIGGSSMGGLMSLYAITAYNKVFSKQHACRPRCGCACRSCGRRLPTPRSTPAPVFI